MVCALLLLGLCCQLTQSQKNAYLFVDNFMSPPKPTLDDLRIERGAKPDRPVRIWPIVISIAALIIAGSVVWWLNRPKPIAVRTVLARETGSASNSVDRTVLNASGYVTARRAATVSSKVTGKVM